MTMTTSNPPKYKMAITTGIGRADVVMDCEGIHEVSFTTPYHLDPHQPTDNPKAKGSPPNETDTKLRPSAIEIKRCLPSLTDAVLKKIVTSLDALSNLQWMHRPPVVLQGTPFQNKVWNALQTIPAGETSTYQSLAIKISRPTAARAVARACAANPIAFFIPCHRIIRSDGRLGGYRWGVERKAQLLRWEGSI